MKNTTSLEIWENTWPPETHTTEYALKRIKSAKSAKLTPIKIDTTDSYGYFQGAHGRYETFLDTCPCGDFRRAKLPCKHIYRLAIELGLMDVEVESDANAIVLPQNERVDFEDVIHILDSLSDKAKYELAEIAKTNWSPVNILMNSSIQELLMAGIIVDAKPENHEIGNAKKTEYAALLDSENIPYDKTATKNELKELCIKYIPEKAIQQFGETLTVCIPKKFSAKKIYLYLRDKFEENTSEQISLLFPVEYIAIIIQYAEKSNMSFEDYIVSAIEEKMDRDDQA